MGAKVQTRMGDGTAVEMTRDELRADIEDGVAAAVKRAKVPPLDDDEVGHLLEIFASQERMTGVPVGDEVVHSCDGSNSLRPSRLDSLTDAEEGGSDLCELQQQDYSYKAVKTVVPSEQRLMQEAQYRLTIPVQYGAQADLGRYSKPDGPCAQLVRSSCPKAASTRPVQRRRRRRPSPKRTWSASARRCGRPAPTA